MRHLRQAAHLACQLQTVQAGHLGVGEQHVGHLQLHLAQRRKAVFGQHDLEAVPFEQPTQLDAHDLGIVGHQHHGLGARARQGRRRRGAQRPGRGRGRGRRRDGSRARRGLDGAFGQALVEQLLGMLPGGFVGGAAASFALGGRGLALRLQHGLGALACRGHGLGLPAGQGQGQGLVVRGLLLALIGQVARRVQRRALLAHRGHAQPQQQGHHRSRGEG